MSVTRKYGLIGHPLGHSLSPYIHERIMDEAGIQGTYTLYDLAPEELERAVPALLKDLDGFNCTIPHKSAIPDFLDSLDDVSRRYGAVNTVFKRRGYNTDREGFLASAPDLSGKRVLLLGAGGVSRMMASEAVVQGAKLTICARNAEKRDGLIQELRSQEGASASGIEYPEEADGTAFDVLLNGTPLGMWPNARRMPTTAAVFREGQVVYDTIYNPCATKWLMQARMRGLEAVSGLSMLLLQAVAAQKIWNPDVDFAEERMLRILPELSRELLGRFPVKYLFTGFMGSGKTTIAARLSRILNIPFLDLDDEIVKARGCSIPEIFERDGEAGFRKTEALVLEELLKKPGSCLLALGGGAIVQEPVQRVCEQYQALTVLVDVSFAKIWQRVRNHGGRPLLGSQQESEGERFTKAAALYEARLPVYQGTADVTIDGDKSKAAVCAETLRIFGLEEAR